MTEVVVRLFGTQSAAAVGSVSHPTRCDVLGIPIIVPVSGKLVTLSSIGRSIARMIRLAAK